MCGSIYKPLVKYDDAGCIQGVARLAADSDGCAKHPDLRAVFALAILWPVPGLFLIIKLPVISIAIAVALMFIGEFSDEEIAFARSIIRSQKK